MKTTLGDVVARLRHAAAVRTLDGLSDRELLGRFAGSNDGEAFAVLVERHGAMVLGVCRRLLPHHDAEDACQAVFLVLARKAGSLRKVESLGCWLHGVARRVAANARRDADLRKAREASAAKRPAEPKSWDEVQQALDEELERLPERYRAPLVLCYLEGLTKDEAAARLGVPAGTVHGRLGRGREMLRARLSKRGLSFPAVLTASALGEGALPPLLAVKTANAAALFAAGQPLTEAVGANVFALTRVVLMSMSMTKVKVATAAALGAAMVATLVGSSFLPAVSAQDKGEESGTSQEKRSGGYYSSKEKRFGGGNTSQEKRYSGEKGGQENRFGGWADFYRTQQKPGTGKDETDEAFIRRACKDLLEREPTAAEVHFFLATKDEGKRRKLIDLFVQERGAGKEAGPARRFGAVPGKESTYKREAKKAEEEAAVHTFILKYASADEVATTVSKVMEKRDVKVVAEVRTNQLVVRAGKADMDNIKKLVETLDAVSKPEGKGGADGKRP
jgi:RNA polymerase sigma factor (sigma-70 family)